MRYTIVCAIALLLSACGFHLATNGDGNGRQLALACSGVSPYLCQQVRNALIERNYHIVNRHSVVLHLLHEDLQQPLSVLGANDRQRHYEMHYRIHFSLSQGKRDIIASDNVYAHRFFTENVNLILGSQTRATQYHRDLQKDAIAKLFERINATGFNKARVPHKRHKRR